MEEQNIPAADPQQLKEQAPTTELKNTFKYFPFTRQNQPVLVLILIGFIFYCTSLYNEYALDDGIIIHQNDYVIKGVKGIPDIITKDSYASFYKRMNASDQLTGGRYQPLSVISFAIEQQIIGSYPNGQYPQNCYDINGNGKMDPDEDLNKDGVFNEIDCQVKGAFMRHFNNVWTYILACVLLYFVFRNHLFKERQDLAFLTALIFMCHPLHTENVANVRGRADIFCLIFIALTFLYTFRYLENKKTSSLILSAIMFFLALLSKEFAFMLIPLIPIAFYVFYKSNFNFKQLIFPAIAFTVITIAMFGFDIQQKALSIDQYVYIGAGFLIFISINAILFRKLFFQKDLNTLMMVLYTSFFVYLTMRLAAVVTAPGVNDNEILNNPYLLANGEEQFCTKIYVFLKYFSLMVFPHPLISDYSYNSVAYRHFTDYDFVVSLLLNLTLLYLGVRLIMKRHVLGFAIAAYYSFLLLFSNFINSGLMMNEHLAFYSVIGFAIALAWFAIEGLDKLQNLQFAGKRWLLLGSLTVVIFLYGCKTWERNWDWKNDITLFLKDVHTAPNSVLVLGNAGARWIDLADIEYFNTEGKKGNLPYSTYKDNELDIIVADNEFKNGFTSDSIILPFQGDKFDNPQHLTMRQRALYKGIGYLKHAVALHPRYVNGYLNLGLSYFKLKRHKEMMYYWKQAENLYPNNPYLKNYYIVTYNMFLQDGYNFTNRGRNDSASYEFNKAVFLDKYNPDGWYNLGGSYYKMRKYEKAKNCWNEVLKLDPKHVGALEGIEALSQPNPPKEFRKLESKVYKEGGDPNAGGKNKKEGC